MKTRFFLSIAGIGLISLILSACGKDTEKLSGKIIITTETTGNFDPSHEYLITFSDLVGIQDYPGGVLISVNATTDTLVVSRVGELLWICLSDIPSNCTDISSNSPTMNQFFFGNPADCDFPAAQYGSRFLVPNDGSVGELTFTIVCN